MSGRASAERVVVIGIGNAFRRDDGAGPRAVALARDRLPAHVETMQTDGEPSRLLDLWEGADLVIVVDAICSGAPPGTVVRAVVGQDPLPRPASGTSTHTSGIAEAVALGLALRRLPRCLVVYGIEGEMFGDGPGLSAAVERGAVAAAARICAEVRDTSRRRPHRAQEDASCA